jgi:uncharacterized protein
MTTFDLRRARLRSGEQFRTELSVRLEPFDYGGERYQPAPADADAELTLTRTPQGHVLDLALQARIEGPCMRCLGNAAIDVRVRAREYHEPGAATEELRTPYVVDDRVEVSAWARDAIALALPEKILCRDECAGLCAGCGADLNSEACRCAPEPGDPRWSKLAELGERLRSA